ncbi:hypothetical protein ACRAWD_01345 [Caulobacter segnis]
MPGAVTIATNMAGRGTDIQLGGSIDMRLANWRQQRQRGMGLEITHEDEVEERARLEAEIADRKKQALDAGGPVRAGAPNVTKARRIDNQLRGRTGRQGDPGRSKFFLSCEGRSAAHLRRRAPGRDHATPSASRKARRSPTSG